MDEVLKDAGIRVEADPDNALVYRFYDARSGLELERFEVERRIGGIEPAPAAPQASPTAPSPAAPGSLPTASAIKVLGEGDSWINLLWPFSGFPKTFFDVLEGRHDARSLGWPGDEFKDMISKKQYKSGLQSGIYQAFIFSGGGNDLLGGGALANILKDKPAGNPSGEDCINRTELDNVMRRMRRGYRTLAQETAVWSPGTILVIHGYDYAIPRNNGKWIGSQLQAKGYDPLAQLSRDIIRLLVDRFYSSLQIVANENSHVELANLRNTVGNRWHDELHPNSEAATDVAAKIELAFGGAAVS